MGFQTCHTHGLRYEDYGECAQCMTERLQEEAMRRQEELLLEQTELMRRAAADRRVSAIATEGSKSINRENVSKDLLKSVLDDAAFETTLDKDGDVVIEDKIRCYVLPNKDRGTIRLLTGFTFKSDTPSASRLEAANQINAQFVMVRASVSGDMLYFDYDVLINDGVSRRGFAHTVKRFCAIPWQAVSECAKPLVK